MICIRSFCSQTPTPVRTPTKRRLPPYKQLLARDANATDAWNNLGNLYLDASRLDEALAAYQSGIAAAPKDADLHYNYACALERKGDNKTATSELEQAVAISPQQSRAWNNLGVLYDQAGDKRKVSMHLRAR